MLRNQRHMKFAGAVVGIVLLVSTVGCGYGEVSSETYDYAMALYSVCNSRDAQRLETFNEQFANAKAEGLVSANESQVLTAIIEEAQAGEWESATAEVRELLEAQVDR